ncbi:MAG: hypothetical protein P4K93_10660, partial [Terracidiphilus sp.]|nr:hypothetical protein [Terracidiphilus sp.]
MDEEDGRPGACSRQFGPLSAPIGAALQSLFQPISDKNFRASSFRAFCERVGDARAFGNDRNRHAKRPSGAKALVDIAGLIGTTKV